MSVVIRPANDARYHHGDLPNAVRHAAVAVIAEKGLGNFSLREVARRAGVSHTAPAHHFGDLAGLMTSLAAEGFTQLQQHLAEAAASTADSAERLHKIGLAYVQVAQGFPSHCQVMLRHDVVNADDPTLEAVAMGAYAVLHDSVAALAADHELRIGLDEAAHLCWSAMQGLLVLYPSIQHIDTRRGQSTPAMEDLVRQFTDVLVAGLIAVRPTPASPAAPDTAVLGRATPNKPRPL